MKTRTLLTASACASVLAGTAAAQPAPASGAASPSLLNDWLRKQSTSFTPWDLGGQVRGRFESKDGFAVAGAGPDAVDFSELTPDNDYWLLRTKLHLGYNSPCGWFSVFAEGRDSQSWEDKRAPEPEQDAADLHQAWLRVGNGAHFPVTLKLGRQELSYGDERLLGTADFGNLGRVFDAAKLRYEDKQISVDAFTGRVVLANDGQFNVANDYDWFSGVYASTRTLIPKQESQLYFLARNTSPESPAATDGSPQAGGPAARDIYTLGLRVKSLPGQFKGWDYDAELAGQLGNFYDGGLKQRLDHQAFAAHAGAGYTFEQAGWKPRLGADYNFASGDSDPGDDRHETFENLFPTNHKFYGFMDFVSWQNLHNARLNASVKPAKGLTLSADYHWFWLADTADFFYTVGGAPRNGGDYGRRPAHDSYLGSELDLIATYAVKNFGQLQAGYAHFFHGHYVKQSLAATGSKDADWFYVQATFNF